jgi:hypothetical protein
MPEKWGPVRSDLEAGLLGDLDTGSKVAARAAAYGEGGGTDVVVSGSIDGASEELVLTVKCSDRIGRLAEILGALSDFGLDIRLAKIDSREGEVVDTFHLTGGPTDIESIERHLAGAIIP